MTQVAQSAASDGSLELDAYLWLNKITLDIIGSLAYIITGTLTIINILTGIPIHIPVHTTSSNGIKKPFVTVKKSSAIVWSTVDSPLTIGFTPIHNPIHPAGTGGTGIIGDIGIVEDTGVIGDTGIVGDTISKGNVTNG